MDLMKFLMHTVREFIWPSSLQSPLSFPTDVPKETIESIRDATIITTIDVEDNFISISTSDADNPEQENTVSFIPGDTLEISNPLNGETMEVLFTGLVRKNLLTQILLSLLLLCSALRWSRLVLRELTRVQLRLRHGPSCQRERWSPQRCWRTISSSQWSQIRWRW